MLRKVTLLAAALLLVGGPALASSKVREPKPVAFSFEGPFGRFDQPQLQRGYKVYREVCAACHGMNLVAFRNLGDPGGPFFDPKFSAATGKTSNDNPVVKALATDTQIADLDNETGDAIQRPGAPADYFPSPFPNVIAAKASNGGIAPPDLSLMAKARAGGPEYIASLLQGFVAPPAGLTVPAGLHYNAWFPGDVSAGWSGDAHHAPEGGFIAMAPPLTADQVSYDDGTKATVKQQSEDVAAFLMWAAEPHMEARKQMGFSVLIFLVLFSGLLYASYRRVWRGESH